MMEKKMESTMVESGYIGKVEKNMKLLQYKGILEKKKQTSIVYRGYTDNGNGNDPCSSILGQWDTGKESSKLL